MEIVVRTESSDPNEWYETIIKHMPRKRQRRVVESHEDKQLQLPVQFHHRDERCR